MLGLESEIDDGANNFFYSLGGQGVGGSSHWLDSVGDKSARDFFLFYSFWGQGGAGADPGFLERGFICIKVYGFAMLILSHFS